MTLSTTIGFCVYTPLNLRRKRPRSVNTLIPRCLAVQPSPQNHKHISIKSAIVALISSALLFNPTSAHAKGILSTNTIFRRYLVTDSDAILRYSLPLPSERLGSTDPVPIRQVQEQLERLGVDLRARGAAGIIAGKRDLGKLNDMLSTGRLDILLDVPAKKRQQAAEILSRMEPIIAQIEREVGVESSNVNASIFPPQVIAVKGVLQDVFTRRNSLAKNTNFDGTLYLR